MTRGRSNALAWGIFALCLAGFVASVYLIWLGRHIPSSSGWNGNSPYLFNLLFGLVVIAFPVVGVLLATRRPENSLGWIMLAIGVVWTLPTSAYGQDSNLVHPLPLANWVLGFDQWLWVPAVGLMGTFLILLFPDGHLPSPRWRWLAWLTASTLAVTSVSILFTPGPIDLPAGVRVANPFGIRALSSEIDVLHFVGLLIPVCMIASAVALVMRYRRSTGVVREQLKWLAYAAALIAAVYLVVEFISIRYTAMGQTQPPWLDYSQGLIVMAFGLIPVSIGIAIFRHRLYDIDLVINKTLVFGALTAFIAAVYVVIVVGLGALIGNRGKPDLTLSIAATAVVAVAFQPVRERVRHWANRLVYGHRSTPLEALSEFSNRMSVGGSDADLLPRMAEILAAATGAARVDVWMSTGDRLRDEAHWPKDADPLPPTPLPEGEALSISGVDHAAPVRHQGRLLGALSLTKMRGEAVSPTEERLVADLASQAGLVLRNAGLNGQLAVRLDELRESRRRLVAAQDEERRRLERDIHDGAQQQLVALSVKLRLAEQLAGRDRTAARNMLAQVGDDTADAVRTLHELAGGIYPRLLADGGLVSALRSQVGTATTPVTIESDGIARYAPDVEAAVYFCTLEAMQNVSKYARASRATIRLNASNGDLRFEIADDGVGFDPASTPSGAGLSNMSDRLDAVGGSLTVRSAPGSGTVVSGTVSLRGRVSV